jgi:hypothetical protein
MKQRHRKLFNLLCKTPTYYELGIPTNPRPEEYRLMVMTYLNMFYDDDEPEYDIGGEG